MGQLILSEGAIVELNGKKVALPQGTSLVVKRNVDLFLVDEEFEVATKDGRLLVESNDTIWLTKNGQHKAAVDCKFVSGGNSFMLIKGDSFDILEEGFWSEFKRTFMGNDKVADLVRQTIDGLMRLRTMIATKAELVAQKAGKHPYDNLLKSQEMEILNQIYRYNQQGMDIDEIVDLLDIEDPTEIVGRIYDELSRIGDERLARRASTLVPRSFLKKFGQLWRGKMAKGNIKQAKFQLATDESGNKYRIVGVHPRMAYPTNPQDNNVYKETTPGMFTSTSDSKKSVKLEIVPTKPKSESDSMEKVVSRAVGRVSGARPEVKKISHKEIKEIIDFYENMGLELQGRKIDDSIVRKVVQGVNISPEKVNKVLNWWYGRKSKKSKASLPKASPPESYRGVEERV